MKGDFSRDVAIQNLLIRNDNTKNYLIYTGFQIIDPKVFQKTKLTTLKKKEQDIEEKAKEKEILSEFYSKEKNIRRESKDVKRQSRYAYKYFLDVIDSLPKNLEKNLKDMPNNKGYIWRGVYFYGKKELIEQCQ